MPPAHARRQPDPPAEAWFRRDTTLRLVQAIASMTTPDGNTITIPGYYAPVTPPMPMVVFGPSKMPP